MANPQGALSRRSFVRLAAIAAAAAAGPVGAGSRAIPQVLPGAGLGLGFEHRKSAIAIGRRYLARYPDDALPAALAQDLRRAGAGDPAAARRALGARVRDDFERGDTVALDGWILARSECRACAALALVAGAAA